jgi:predicted nucleotidyltransferase
MISYDASTIADLEPTAVVLADLHRNAAACGVDMMVVGAAARDILIRHVVGSAPQRATSDIDIAVAVASWADIDRLTEGTHRADRSAHKFVVRGVEVDIIPFGPIESDERTITWPDDHRMHVFGFREALSAAVQVKLPGELVVAVASLPAQSILKVLAWRDRRYQSRRDAIDLKTILCAYREGPYLEELYVAYEELLERHGFDPTLAGTERMGREAAALIAPADRHVVTGLLFDEDRLDALAADMGGAMSGNGELLLAYRNGFRLDVG